MIKRFTESKCAADTEEPEEAANTRESRKRPRVGAGPINNTLEDQGHPVGRVEKQQQRNIKLKVLKKTIYRRKSFVAFINVVQKSNTNQ